ncbi:MAG TPA: PAS domain S-box protein, partial [Burkholderiales bacterium]|nr:PAS domain S-box protein [Burkholderiales bacterium]
MDAVAEPPERELLAAVLDVAGVALCVTDERGVYVAASPEYCRMAGREAARLIGRRFTVLLPAALREAALREYRDLLGQRDGHLRSCTCTYAGGVHRTFRQRLHRGARSWVLTCAVEGRTRGERARAEQALRESDERMRRIVETAQDAVITIDERGVTEGWNAEAERMFGWRAQEAIGRRLSSLIVPVRLREAHELGLRRYLDTGKGRILNDRIEITALHRDGREFPVELSVWTFSMRGARWFSAFVRDISERKNAEWQAQARGVMLEQHRRALLELAQLDKADFGRALAQILALDARTLGVERLSYWTLADDRSTLTCNAMYRRSRAELDPEMAGLSLAAANYPRYFAALATDRPIVANDALRDPLTAEFAEGYLAPNGIGAMLDVAVWFRGKAVGVVCHEHVGGRRRWLPEEVDFAGSIATMVSLALEAHQRHVLAQALRASEENLQQSLAEREAILQTSVVGIAFLYERRIRWANHTLAAMLGYPADELIGRSTEQFYAWPQDYDRVALESKPLLVQGRDYDIDVELRRKDGGVFWCHVSGKAIDPANLGRGSIWVARDISPRKRLEQELRNTLEQERELGELKSRFVSMTSHEFRTPLATILSSAELLQDYGERLPAQEKAELTQHIRSAVARMTHMLDDVLMIGKVDAGRMEFDPRPLDVVAFCRSVLEETRKAAGTGHELR